MGMEGVKYCNKNEDQRDFNLASKSWQKNEKRINESIKNYFNDQN